MKREKGWRRSPIITLGKTRSVLDVAGENISIFRIAGAPSHFLRRRTEGVKEDCEGTGLVNRRKKLIKASRSDQQGFGLTSSESRQQNASILRNEIKGDSLLRIMTEDQVTFNNRILTLSEKGDLKELIKLIESGKQNIKWESCRGLHDYTPLHYACSRGHLLVAWVILKAAPSMLHTMTNTDESPLHLAVAGKQLLLVELLLDKGADVDAQNRDGETCLMYACRMAQAAMVRLLLARGAQMSTQDKYGDTAADHCDNDKRLMHWLELHFAREHQAKDAREGERGERGERGFQYCPLPYLWQFLCP